MAMSVDPTPERWQASRRLEGLLSDPLVQMVMRSDDVSEAALRRLLATARTRLRAPLATAAGASGRRSGPGTPAAG